MQNIVVMLKDEPGTLAQVGEALGAAGINIHGMCGFPDPPGGTLNLLVDDAGAAQEALNGSADASVRDVREVIVVGCPDEPGAMGSVTRKLADAGIDVDLIYQAAGERLVIGTRDDLERTRDILGV